MPRFIIEELMTADFLKNLVDNPRDRAQELQPMMQVAGLTLEERYFVVGEIKHSFLPRVSVEGSRTCLSSIMNHRLYFS